MKGEQDINAIGCCTGKLSTQGGIEGQGEACGLGVFYAVRELFDTKSFLDKAGFREGGIEGKTFMVQGLGKVGYPAAKAIVEAGGLVTTIVEINSSVHNP